MTLIQDKTNRPTSFRQNPLGMAFAQPRIRVANPFRLEPQQELQPPRVDPVAVRLEARRIFGGIHFPFAGVEPDIVAREKATAARIPCVRTSSITPANVGLDTLFKKALHLRSVVPTHLDL